MSIGIDFGIGMDENLWYRPGIVSKPRKLVSAIPSLYIVCMLVLGKRFVKRQGCFLVFR